MAKQSKEQRQTVGRVMHEYKHGELERGRGGKVRSPRQAVAIALHESGSSKYESGEKNRENLRRTKRKESRGETAMAEKEGGRTSRPAGSRRTQTGPTKADLYDQARRRNLAGRASMSKDELARALRP